jgi:E3 ubiquitin-protein ligase UBR7
VAEFENECTFALGYIRQPVYVCMTCHGPESPFYGEAGICLACSMHCHLDHDIVELFSKTDFRCDCGTQKCAEACQLNIDQTSGSVPSTAKIRDEFNERNVYNHNFKGLYCYCEGEYKETDTMIQCSKCDDWFHDRCISLVCVSYYCFVFVE